MPDQPSHPGVKAGYPESPAPDYPQLPPALARLLDRFPNLKRRPHPMLAHFPIVFLLSATFFSLLYVITGDRSFDATAFYCLGGALLTLPPTIATGLFTHWLNFYGGADRTVHIEKRLSYSVIVIAAAAFIWRWLNPLVLTDLQRPQPHLLFPGPVPDPAGDGQRLFRGHAHFSPGRRGPTPKRP